MIKKEHFIPLILVGLAVAFLTVSALVTLSRGKPSLIRAKLRLGGLILALSGALNGCDTTEVMCYEPVRFNFFNLTRCVETSEGCPINLKESARLEGKVTNRSGTSFSFRLLREADKQEIQRGALQPEDGTWDEDEEAFSIALDPDLLPGTYLLNFYENPVETQPEYSREVIRLRIGEVPKDGGVSGDAG